MIPKKDRNVFKKYPQNLAQFFHSLNETGETGIMYYFKKVIIWLVLLLVGLIMLYGRYDWSDPVYPHSQ